MKKTVVKKRRKLGTLVPGIILICLLALLLWVANFYIKRQQSSTGPSQATSGTPTPAQRKAEAATGLGSKKAVTESSTSTNSTSTTTSTPASAQNIDLSAKTETNGMVTVVTKLTNVSSGSCTLSIQNNGKTYNDTADIIYQPEYSTCAGFSVPIPKLGSGIWDITLTVNTKEQSVNKTISFRVE